MGSGAIEQRLRDSRLHRLRRGVYLVGHPAAGAHAREMAAVLACGEGSVLSHLSAARLWRLLDDGIELGPIDVTVPGRDPGGKPGIRAHRVRALAPHETRRLQRIPITSPARTLLDVAPELEPRDLERCLASTLTRRLARHRDLAALLQSHPRRPGAAALRALIGSQRGPSLTRSEAEAQLLDLVRRAGLPDPETNVRMGRCEVDMIWRTERLVVEVDGFRFHGSRASFERDRVRDGELQAQGLRVMRVTWRQLTEGPEALLVRLVRALAVPQA